MITTAPRNPRTMLILTRLRGALILSMGSAALALNAQAQDSTAPWFQEEAAAAGLDWKHVSGAPVDRRWFPEIMGGGVALFDYDGDLYGRRVRLAFVRRLRDEVRFDSVDALVALVALVPGHFAVLPGPFGRLAEKQGLWPRYGV